MAKILNVDDHAINRYIRTEVLRDAGYDVVEASNGEEALRMYVQERPQLVLLDINMPDMHGTEVCRRIREDTSAVSVMIVHISASDTSDQSRALGLEHGADGYLVEPVEPELLLATVRSALRLWTAEASLEQNLAESRAMAETLRQTNVALKRSNEDLTQFAYAASHDLQEPLRTVACYTELLEKEYRGHLDDAAHTYLSFTKVAVDRMQTLIHDLLTFASVQNADAMPSAPVDVNDVVKLVVADLKKAIDESEATVSYRELPSIHANPAQLTQVFQNLIGNSIKYRKLAEAPRVEISAERDGAGWLFCVRDNGQGFEQENAKKIFGVFHRLHGRDVPGTGIGLAVVKKIIERHGGEVWAESTLGDGAAFYFRIGEENRPAAARVQYAAQGS